MAQLRCSACGAAVDEADVTCPGCGSLLGVPGAVSRVEEALTAVLDVAAGSARQSPVMCSTPGCGQPATRGRTVCRMCFVRGAQTRTYVLLTPWGDRVILTEGTSVPIGRSRDFSSYAARLDGMDSVSRSHAFFECRDGRLVVRDLDSTNGTRVNGARIAAQQETTLVPGDVVTLGGQVEFIVG